MTINTSDIANRLAARLIKASAPDLDSDVTKLIPEVNLGGLTGTPATTPPSVSSPGNESVATPPVPENRGIAGPQQFEGLPPEEIEIGPDKPVPMPSPNIPGSGNPNAGVLGTLMQSWKGLSPVTKWLLGGMLAGGLLGGARSIGSGRNVMRDLLMGSILGSLMGGGGKWVYDNFGPDSGSKVQDQPAPGQAQAETTDQGMTPDMLMELARQKTIEDGLDPNTRKGVERVGEHLTQLQQSITPPNPIAAMSAPANPGELESWFGWKDPGFTTPAAALGGAAVGRGAEFAKDYVSSLFHRPGSADWESAVKSIRDRTRSNFQPRKWEIRREMSRVPDSSGKRRVPSRGRHMFRGFSALGPALLAYTTSNWRSNADDFQNRSNKTWAELKALDKDK